MMMIICRLDFSHPLRIKKEAGSKRGQGRSPASVMTFSAASVNRWEFSLTIQEREG